jgi:hypothetical protein
LPDRKEGEKEGEKEAALEFLKGALIIDTRNIVISEEGWPIAAKRIVFFVLLLRRLCSYTRAAKPLFPAPTALPIKPDFTPFLGNSFLFTPANYSGYLLWT